ncbi:hypothetical protein J6590_052361 [Homalodisca vitripennis]|nr:hypothetical protein J6590_052361 [Homalodisca vitripennis]
MQPTAFEGLSQWKWCSDRAKSSGKSARPPHKQAVPRKQLDRGLGLFDEWKGHDLQHAPAPRSYTRAIRLHQGYRHVRSATPSALVQLYFQPVPVRSLQSQGYWYS